MATTAKTFLVRPIALLALIAAALATAGCGINNIPTYDQSAKAAWSEVLSQYKRRSDLIPNLVESVKGFADQEKSVLTEVTKARQQVTNIQLPPDILTNPDADEEIPGRAGNPRRCTRPADGSRRDAIPISNPGRTSWRSKMSLPGRKTASPSRVATTSGPSRPITPRLRPFPAAGGNRSLYPQSKEMATFDIPAEEQKVPKVDFKTKT